MKLLQQPDSPALKQTRGLEIQVRGFPFTKLEHFRRRRMSFDSLCFQLFLVDKYGHIYVDRTRRQDYKYPREVHAIPFTKRLIVVNYLSKLNTPNIIFAPRVKKMKLL